MKKVLFLFAFVLSAGLITAQDAAVKKSCSKTCAKACEAKKASASVDTETKVASAETAAVIAAAEEAGIERKVCDVTGNVSYYKKTTCEHSGSVKMTEVKYDNSSNAFVNVSPMDHMNEGEAKVVKTSEKTSAKAKTCSKSGEKACCASKKKGA